MIVVSNTSPISALDAIGRLWVMERLWGRVTIPPAVAAELAARGMARPPAPWIEERHLAEEGFGVSRLLDLDPGEAEALALAMEMGAGLVLMDERLGRRVAERLGLRRMGVIGMLQRAKMHRVIPELKPALDDLRSTAGFWIGSALYDRVLRDARE